MEDGVSQRRAWARPSFGSDDLILGYREPCISMYITKQMEESSITAISLQDPNKFLSMVGGFNGVSCSLQISQNLVKIICI